VQTNRWWIRRRSPTSQRYQSHIRRLLVVELDVVVPLSFASNESVSARQRQGCPTLEGQPTLPLRAFGTLSDRRVFSASSSSVLCFTIEGGTTTAFLLSRATQTPSPFFVNISRDYYLCPIRSTHRAYTRLHAISTFLSPEPPDSPLALLRV